jgi:hypothetical protein
MDALSPKARALLQKSRTALRPTSADRARIDEALRSQVGAANPAATGPVTPPVSLTLSKLIAGGTLGAVVLGSVIVWFARTEHGASPPSAPLSPPIAARSRSQPADEAVPLTPHVKPNPDAVVPRPRATRERNDLAGEVALLSRAIKELRNGDAETSLRTLERHRRRFPNGALSEERRSAMAQALCAVGRVNEGRAEQAKLGPRTPAAIRAKQACDAAGRDLP